MKNSIVLSALVLFFASAQANAADFYMSANGSYPTGGGAGVGWDFASGVQMEINLDAIVDKSEETGAKVSFNVGYGPHIGAFQPVAGLKVGVAALDGEEAGALIGGNVGGYFWIGDRVGLGSEYLYEVTGSAGGQTLKTVLLKAKVKF